MKELKVLITPWGDPIGWQKVKYRFGNERVKEWRGIGRIRSFENGKILEV